MTDLVERLRRDLMEISYDEIEAMVREAAAKIERLRVEVARRDGYHLFTLQELNNTGLKEIERLRAELRAVLLHVVELRAEVAEWKERWAAERRDHEATIRHFDKPMDEAL